jgi:predicted DNA-binding mobile mystery protein A
MDLIIKQLDDYYQTISPIRNTPKPKRGWVKTIRTALGMTSVQLAKRLNITRQSVLEIENREMNGSITLKNLKEVATALDMRLIYCLFPKDGTLEALIERRAREIATQMILSSSEPGIFEDRENDPESNQEAIRGRMKMIMDRSPKMLWD